MVLKMQRIQPGSFISGLGLLLVGGWLLIVDLAAGSGVRNQPQLVGLDRLWPVIPIVAGLALLTQYGLEERKRNGLVFVGFMALSTGIFLCAFTFRIGRLSWADMGKYWPVFLIIGGAAFLILFIADGMRDMSLMRPVYLIGGGGLFALPLTMGIIRSSVIDQVARLWPLLLVPIALALFVRLRVRGRGHNASD